MSKFTVKPPAVALVNPKFYHNVGATIRAASCWGAEQVIWSGDRVPHPDDPFWDEKGLRMPREERMKGYKDVELVKDDYFFKNMINYRDVVPVAIELMPNSENLFQFEHPDNALYVFGPENGSLTGTILQHCHRFIQIPTAHCLNLAAAVNVVLSHRRAQRMPQWESAQSFLAENRGFIGDG